VDSETKSIKIDWEDEIITGSLVTRDGKSVHPSLAANGNGANSANGAANPSGAASSAPPGPSADTAGEARQ
ncbi:MAG: hypothetical protein HQ514_13635, partial [Rhodospirillales bacterium]|nr:hypothetical protein [Rhodospirillales bacterium]